MIYASTLKLNESTTNYKDYNALYTELFEILTEKYGEYVGEMKQNGLYDFFKNQSRYMRFMLFSQNAFSYNQTFRKIFKRWVITGNTNVYDYGQKYIDSARRVNDSMINRAKSFNNYEMNDVAQKMEALSNFANEIVTENPILLDESLSKKHRMNLLNAALRSGEAKEKIHIIDNIIKEVSKEIVSKMFDEAEKIVIS